MVSTPKAPDPVATAAAQSGMNRDTAQTQQLSNMIDQVGPDGNLTYQQSGSNSFVDSTGKTVVIPKFTAVTSLSQAQQNIKNQTDAATLNLGTLANEQSAKIRDLLNKPFEYNNADAEKWAYDLGASRLDPRFQREQEALRSQLIASGLRPGSEAFDQQMAQFGQTKNDAYNQLALNGRSQAFQEALTERNQPINEISALMSGSQVSMPNSSFVSTPQTGVAGTDYMGMVNNNYNSQVNASNAKMGGLFGLLSAPFQLGNMKSDRRAKRDIRQIGTLRNGLPWYEFRYLEDPESLPVRQGVMSDDVRNVMPEAVGVDAEGLDFVDYIKVLEAA